MKRCGMRKRRIVQWLSSSCASIRVVMSRLHTTSFSGRDSNLEQAGTHSLHNSEGTLEFSNSANAIAKN